MSVYQLCFDRNDAEETCTKANLETLLTVLESEEKGFCKRIKIQDYHIRDKDDDIKRIVLGNTYWNAPKARKEMIRIWDQTNPSQKARYRIAEMNQIHEYVMHFTKTTLAEMKQEDDEPHIESEFYCLTKNLDRALLDLRETILDAMQPWIKEKSKIK